MDETAVHVCPRQRRYRHPISAVQRGNEGVSVGAVRRRCAVEGCPNRIPGDRPPTAQYCSKACKERAAKRRQRTKTNPLPVPDDAGGEPSGRPCGNPGCVNLVPAPKVANGGIYCSPECRYEARKETRRLIGERERLAEDKKQVERLYREFSAVAASANTAVVDHRTGYSQISQQLEAARAQATRFESLYREAMADREELALLLLAVVKRYQVPLQAEARAYAQSFLTDESQARLAGRRGQAA